MISVLLLLILFLCWGSFLNVIAYRLIHDVPFTGRSRCVHCQTSLQWFDLIPIASWFWLKGTCRYCGKPISILYPFIELFTALSLVALYYQIPFMYWLSYTVFFSALIIVIRSDLETMLISRWVTLFAVPLGFLCAYLHLLPITLSISVFGALSAYGTLYGVAKIYQVCARKDGMGQGDIDLLTFIGSFLGLQGWWISLLIGSLLGTVVGILLLLRNKNAWKIPLPFGPFLALGAIIYSLIQWHLPNLLFLI